MKSFVNNSAFLISAPELGDNRPRNAFGVLKDFGIAYGIYYAQRDDGLLFPLPPRHRSLSAMRFACIRRLCEIEHQLDNHIEDMRNDGKWTAWGWLCGAEARFERLLRCIEGALLPGLAALRDKQEAAIAQREKDARFAAECEVERKADARRLRIESDPRVAAALAVVVPLNLVADAAERERDAAEDAARGSGSGELRKRVTAARGKVTRAQNAVTKAYRMYHFAQRDAGRIV